MPTADAAWPVLGLTYRPLADLLVPLAWGAAAFAVSRRTFRWE
jgi:hypothetical protein